MGGGVKFAKGMFTENKRRAQPTNPLSLYRRGLG